MDNPEDVSPIPDPPLRIAAIGFLNPAPLMWDFEHPPRATELARRYSIRTMLPSACADQLWSGAADIGLVPIAALAAIPGLRILPGSAIASKGAVRSLLLVRRSGQPLERIRSVAADTASRTTVAYARLLFHRWGNPEVPFLPMAADLDAMLDRADAAIVIGDPALLALEERVNRLERTGEPVIYHDLAAEWRDLTGLPYVAAVWAIRSGSAARAGLTEEEIAADFERSRDHGIGNVENMDQLVSEWSARLPLPAATVREYLTSNIHYVLDEECIAGMRGFFREAARIGLLPAYEPVLGPVPGGEPACRREA